MITYLEAGGSVYFEGNDIGYNNNGYDIWAYTGLTYAGDGSASTTGNVQSITGDLFCSGMDFNYPYKTEADGYIDFFTPNGGDLIFESQDAKGRVGCYTGPTDNYRTITSGVFFSVLQENATTRGELMAAYMEFLTGGTGVSEDGNAAFSTFDVVAVSPSTGIFSATVTLQETALCDLGLFDVTGRRVGTLASGSLSNGTHNLSASASGMASGTYLISGTIGDQRVNVRTV
ncbi:MAG: hypothetical protein KAS73_01960, partial [Candidatus Sabulitectum sp.]|nr:hypothetical protein [Candidatus Sabulitectum sp.]